MTLGSTLHRHVWQRLPRELRRRALFTASGLLAGRPDPAARPSDPLIVAGVLGSSSGMGESARLCLAALRANGVGAHGVDITAIMMQPVDHPLPGHTAPGSLTGPGSLIIHVNGPFMALALAGLGRRFLAGKYVVGYWAWELPRVPDEWRAGLRYVHEIWVPSRFVADAVAGISGSVPVRVMPHPLAAPGTGKDLRCGRRAAFTVLTIFNTASSIARKNPYSAIAAFKRAFGADPGARFIIKCSGAESCPVEHGRMMEMVRGCDNIEVIDRVTDRAGIEQLYNEADVLLSLHRSEGFGLTLAEAMLVGLPVVATDWSGSVDFLDAGCGMPIGYRLVPAHDPQRTYDHPDMLWADADVDEAAAALRRLRADASLRDTLGHAAAARMAQLASPVAYAARASELLRL